MPPEVFSAHFPVHSPHQQFQSISYSSRSLQCTFTCTEIPQKQIYSLSYSFRSLQGTIPCTVHLIKSSSPCPIPPEVFSAHFSVESALAAGLVTDLFLQTSLMHNPLFRAPFQSVQFLSYYSRSPQCPFPCVQRPMNMSSPFPITLEVFLAHSTVQSALPEGILSFLFLGKFSMHVPLYRPPYQQVYALSSSTRNFQCTFPNTEQPITMSSLFLILEMPSKTFSVTEQPISMSSPLPIPTEVFTAYSPAFRALSAGQVPLLFLQNSSMNISLYRAPYQQVQSLPGHSRNLHCLFPQIESPISRCIPLLFLPNSSMHILLYTTR